LHCPTPLPSLSQCMSANPKCLELGKVIMWSSLPVFYWIEWWDDCREKCNSSRGTWGWPMHGTCFFGIGIF
jgi:hypothetical protein